MLEYAREEAGGDDWESTQIVRSYLEEHGVAIPADLGVLALADVLLAHYESLPGEDFVNILGVALTRHFETLAREYCRREVFLLEPLLIAEDAVVRVLMEAVRGDRPRPLAAHADRYVAEAAGICIADPVAFLFQPPEDPTSSDAVMLLYLHHACGLVNHMSPPHRRMAWLAWVDGRPLVEIERLTGIPLERVEFFLTRLLELAKDRMASDDWGPPLDPGAELEEGGDCDG